MRTVDIPGGTAELREKLDMKVRHRRLVESAALAAASAVAKLPGDREELEALDMSKLDLTKDEADGLFALQDATIIATLASWTLPDALPTVGTVQDLDQELYDALAAATSDIGTSIATGIDFDPSSPADPGFEGTPTVPSDGSAADSRADQGSSLTETPNGTTQSSVTAGSSPG